MILNLENLSLEERITLLKEIMDTLDIVATGAYGATEFIGSEDVHIAKFDDYGIKKGETILIHTRICTG
jgi:hypothetical protein